MQKSMSYGSRWYRRPPYTHQNSVRTSARSGSGPIRVIDRKSGDVESMIQENAVIVFASRGCCMSHVVKCLLRALGANPAVYEVEEKDVDDVVGQLVDAGGGGTRGLLQFPAVFIGGRWFGGPERIIATHIKEELTPLLKEAGALWL